MGKRSRTMATILFLAMATVLTGCASYYKITDPGSGREYYTNDWVAGRYRYNGAVAFKDGKSGSTVTLQSSEVQSVTKEQYYESIGKPVPK